MLACVIDYVEQRLTKIKPRQHRGEKSVSLKNPRRVFFLKNLLRKRSEKKRDELAGRVSGE